MKYTMQNIREMKPFTDTELIAYGRTCEAFKELNVEGTNKLPNFKKLYKNEIDKFSRKKTNVSAAADVK